MVRKTSSCAERKTFKGKYKIQEVQAGFGGGVFGEGGKGGLGEGGKGWRSGKSIRPFLQNCIESLYNR